MIDLMRSFLRHELSTYPIEDGCDPFNSDGEYIFGTEDDEDSEDELPELVTDEDTCWNTSDHGRNLSAHTTQGEQHWEITPWYDEIKIPNSHLQALEYDSETGITCGGMQYTKIVSNLAYFTFMCSSIISCIQNCCVDSE